MIKAIETEYKGYRFRSRLEARWAVFFDDLELPWEYEPEGFILSSGKKYLPDFKLPHCGLFNSSGFGGVDLYIEVKPESVTNDELNKAICFAAGMNRRSLLMVAVGDPLAVFSRKTLPVLCSGPSQDCPCGQKDCETFIIGEVGAYVGECKDQKCSQKLHLYLVAKPKEDSLCLDFQRAVAETFNIIFKPAASRARSARFEHGETP